MIRVPVHPTPADVTLAFLCALTRSRPGSVELHDHRPCRFCAISAADLGAWADLYGRPVDPLPARAGKAAR